MPFQRCARVCVCLSVSVCVWGGISRQREGWGDFPASALGEANLYTEAQSVDRIVFAVVLSLSSTDQILWFFPE